MTKTELAILVDDFGRADVTRSGAVPLASIPQLLALHLQRDPSDSELNAVQASGLPDPLPFAAWVERVSGEDSPNGAYPSDHADGSHAEQDVHWSVQCPYNPAGPLEPGGTAL